MWSTPMISIVKCKKPFPMKKSKRSYVFRCKFKKNVLKRVLGLELGPYVCEVNQINQKRRSPRPEADLFCVMRSASPEPAPASPSPQYQPAPAPTQFSKMWVWVRPKRPLNQVERAAGFLDWNLLLGLGWAALASF